MPQHDERDSVFSEEWRRCLREHYKHVIRTDDRVTRRSLEPVLESLGFREDELRDLYVAATLRAEELPDDFVPEGLGPVSADAPAAAPEATTDPARNPAHPLECQCPECTAIDLLPHDADGQPLDDEALAELREREAWEREHSQSDADDADADSPQQLSLF